MPSSELPESVELQERLTQMHIEKWLKDDLFHANWWILLGLNLIALVAWLLLLDKGKLKRTCLYAGLMAILALGLEEYGEELILWDFPTDILPVFPPLTSFNLMLLPLCFSLAFQRFTATRSFLIAALVISAILCFVVEPLLSWGGFYQLINWQFYFSYPIYVALAMLVRYLAIKIDDITEKRRLAAG